MTKWWKPTRKSYFDHVTKARIHQVLIEALLSANIVNVNGIKKDVSAAMAERQLAETAWLLALLASRPSM